MGQSAEELRREIEQSRGQLTTTVDAIGDRVSPGRVVDRKVNRVKGSMTSAKERVMGTASGAFGAVGDTVSGAASSVTGATSGVAGSAGGTLGAAGEQLRNAPESIKATTAEKAQGAPLIAGLVAFGAGALVATLVKPSEGEGRVAQAVLNAAQPVKDAATQAGQELVSSLKDQG